MLEASQSIYSGLSTSVDDDLKSVYVGRISELLPQIRYCAYSIGDASAALDLKGLRRDNEEGDNLMVSDYQLEELLKQVQALQAVNVTEVSWIGLVIPVKLEKARLAVLACQVGYLIC